MNYPEPILIFPNYTINTTTVDPGFKTFCTPTKLFSIMDGKMLIQGAPSEVVGQTITGWPNYTTDGVSGYIHIKSYTCDNPYLSNKVLFLNCNIKGRLTNS